jgi:hypothetical protein
MTKTKFLHRADVWAKIAKTIQLTLGLFQLGTLGARELSESVVSLGANFWVGAGQVVVAIVSFWTEDRNNDNIIDVVQDPVQTQITIESKGPVKVTDVEIKPSTE